MICPLTLTMQQASGTINDLEDHLRKLNIVMKCCEANCAWWDVEKKQCCIKTLAYRLTNINRGMAK